MNPIQLLLGDVLEQLCHLPSDSVHCVVTSPPYWQVRDYGVTGQLGREATLEEHLRALTRVFAEVRRVLHPWGTCWVNYGDMLAQNGRHLTPEEQETNHRRARERGYASSVYDRQWQRASGTARGSGLAEKQLMLCPEQLVLALRSDGWEREESGRWKTRGYYADGSVNWAAMEGDAYAVEVALQHLAMECRAYAMRLWFGKWAAERGLS